MKYNHLFIVILPGLISFNCCSNELLNLSSAKNAVIRYHESGEYEKDLTAAVEEAKEKFEKINFKDSMVVIFDVDETALSNYEVNVKYDFGYIPDLWSQWIEEARAPAVKPVKELYDMLLQRNSRIIFLTGRKNNEYDATLKNLKLEGYSSFDTLITRGDDENLLSAVTYKSSKRAELTNKGYTVAGTVGDQWSDLDGAFHGIQVKLPNFIYSVE